MRVYGASLCSILLKRERCCVRVCVYGEIDGGDEKGWWGSKWKDPRAGLRRSGRGKTGRTMQEAKEERQKEEKKVGSLKN